MAQNLPVNFPIEQESILSNYNWADIAGGQGYALFYLAQTRDSSGGKSILTPNQDYGNVNGSNGFTSTNYTSFDTSVFNVSRIVKGTAYFSGQVRYVATSGEVTASLYKVDENSVETLIGAEVTSETYAAANYFNLSFIISKTKMKKGEFLRLKVKTSTALLWISVDPKGNLPSGIAPSRIQIPFEIQE